MKKPDIMPFLRHLFFQFILFTGFLSAFGQSLTLITWNLQKLGATKDDTEIRFIAQIIRHADVVAIQEVVVNPAGAQAVARLVLELNTMGADWDYVVSNPTSSTIQRTERYAFLWKKSKVKLVGKAWLENKYEARIDREPFLATFDVKGKQFTIVNYHAITRKSQSESEIRYLTYLPIVYSKLNLIFAGDFNLPQSHLEFKTLKSIGYRPALVDQKTTLKQKCVGDECLCSEYDNIFYFKSRLNVIETGIIPFYLQFETLQQAREISDHVPVYLTTVIL
ncbi:MAG: endonuclease/exonuclease/phosphatase family protein [Lentimicrobium sp.]|jgi:endonuclease/exonuclease/phosphatase family metal-dependent hydrolase|nr:endonuclease/exonuclease/phosphatase family protein [Lentimicrobium sp.]